MTRKKNRGLLQLTIRSPAICTAQPPVSTHRKNTGRKEKQMYLKEGNIGKAESEEVVPVKTEQKSPVTLAL